MWVWYCRPPTGAHFHPTPQPPPVPQQLGEKAHLRTTANYPHRVETTRQGSLAYDLLQVVYAKDHWVAVAYEDCDRR